MYMYNNNHRMDSHTLYTYTLRMALYTSLKTRNEREWGACEGEGGWNREVERS